MSGYAVTAQYYDPLMAAAHGGVDRQVAAALIGLDTASGPVVDVGAGTGLSTLVIASALPAAAIIAVEPDPAMRPALMARIWDSPDLRGRVTLLPFGIFEAPLPKNISGAVLSAVLVHFSPPEPARLWRLLAARLTPGGRAVVEIQPPPTEARVVMDLAEVAVGQIVYGGTARVERTSSELLCWSMTYRACFVGEPIVNEATEFTCWAITAELVVAEAEVAGLAARAQGDLVILTTSDRL